MRSPDRSEIETVLSADVSQYETAYERNQARLGTLEAWIDNSTDYDFSARSRINDMTLREMILSDVESYPQWEKSDE